MKIRFLCLAGLMLAAMAGQVQGAMVFSSGAINGTLGGRTISATAPDDVAVSNSFSLSSATTLTAATAGIWNRPGSTLTSVEWSIGTSKFGTDVASGMSSVSYTYIGQGLSYYDVYEAAFSLNAVVSTGTYWLTLQHAVSTLNNDVYWDVNTSTISATAYQKNAGYAEFQVQGSSFALFDDGDTNTVPEPASLAMWGLGAIGIVFARRKRQQKKLTA